MQPASPLNIRRVFLYSLIASVVITAVLGIILILSGRSQWLEVRVLFTSLTISGASICGLACGALLDKSKGHWLALTGIVLAMLAGSLLILGIWTDPHQDEFWKVTLSAATLAVALAHLSLLSIARLAKRFAWLLGLSYFFVLTVAGMIIFAIFAKPRDDWFWRSLAAAAIATAAVTVLTPIFHWLSRDEIGLTSSSMATIDAEIARLRTRIEELENEKQNLL